ncbi:hypothetical protein Lal_00002827 [Lupinus albus]|nr:hypothetical protein Lal_00002827 [Lupinus albus]
MDKTVSIHAQEYSKGDLKLVTQKQFQVLDQVTLYSHDPISVRQHPLILPPSSPYDKFLKAAGSIEIRLQ